MDYPVESFSDERASIARAALHEPRPARVRPGRSAGDGQGRDVRPLLALPGHAATDVPGRVRRRCGLSGHALRRGGGRTGARAVRADLPRLRRRFGGPARWRAHRLRVGLERDDQAAAARAAGRLPRAVHALHGLRRPDGRGSGLSLLALVRARPGVRGGDGLPVRHLLRDPPAGGGVVGRAVPAGRRRARGRAPAFHPRQGARPPARPAARGVALTRGHLRQRAGLRAAAPAPVRLAASGGARLRRDDPQRAQGRDAELRGARRASRTRRRVDRLPRGAGAHG